MTTQAHWDYQVAKTPVKAALRRMHAVDRVAALSNGEAAAGGETVQSRLDELDGLTDALRRADRCRRCGKKLEQGHCQARGYGDDCWRLELAAGRVSEASC